MYERDNIKTIGKLKRKTIPNVKRINGALRQTINAHGPITKQFIGSASKRIYGALLEIKKPTYLDGLYEKILKLFK